MVDENFRPLTAQPFVLLRRQPRSHRSLRPPRVPAYADTGRFKQPWEPGEQEERGLGSSSRHSCEVLTPDQRLGAVNRPSPARVRADGRACDVDGHQAEASMTTQHTASEIPTPRQLRLDVDEVAVERILSGQLTASDARLDDVLAAWLHLETRGLGPAAIASRVGVTHNRVKRWRAEHRLATDPKA